MSSSPPTKQITIPPRIYLLLLNPSKSNNLGPILRCAAAFGVFEVVLVGFAKCSVKGSHGSSKYVAITSFPTVDQAVTYLRGNCSECSQLVGVLGGVANAYKNQGYNILELMDDYKTNIDERVHVNVNSNASTIINNNQRSFPIDVCPFQKGGNCCFVIDKKCNGLPSTLAKHCDTFVHIPHMSAASSGQQLDAPACLSIALYHFTAWAGYQERNMIGYKFELQPGTKVTSSANTEERAKQREQQERDAAKSLEDGGILFEHGLNGDY